MGSQCYLHQDMVLGLPDPDDGQSWEFSGNPLFWPPVGTEEQGTGPHRVGEFQASGFSQVFRGIPVHSGCAMVAPKLALSAAGSR